MVAYVYVIILSPLWVSELLGVTPEAIPKRITDARGWVINWNTEDLILLHAMEPWANSRDFPKSWFPFVAVSFFMHSDMLVDYDRLWTLCYTTSRFLNSSSSKRKTHSNQQALDKMKERYHLFKNSLGDNLRKKELNPSLGTTSFKSWIFSIKHVLSIFGFFKGPHTVGALIYSNETSWK